MGDVSIDNVASTVTSVDGSGSVAMVPPLMGVLNTLDGWSGIVYEWIWPLRKKHRGGMGALHGPSVLSSGGLNGRGKGGVRSRSISGGTTRLDELIVGEVGGSVEELQEKRRRRSKSPPGSPPSSPTNSA